MQVDSKDQERLRQYLLGSLPLEERQPFEERLLTDGEFFEELLIVEDELVDHYLSGELTEAERESFETYFCVAPERREKVRFARALKKYVDNAAEAQTENFITAAVPRSEPIPAFVSTEQKQPFFSFWPRNPILSYSLAATLVLVIGAVSWMALNRLKNPGLEEPGQVLAVVLTPGLTRDGGEIKKISIPPGTGTLQLRLELSKADYSSYRAELLTSERVSIAIREGLQAETSPTGKFITLPISRSSIKRDDYSVKLGGKRPDGSYEDVTSFVFRVIN